MIEITQETMERAQTLLEGVPKGVERAFSNAINRGISHVRTQAFNKVKRVYTVKQNALKKTTATQIQKASMGKLVGYVSFAGTKMPLYEFQVTPKEPGTGKKVRARVLKDGGGEFDSAFIANAIGGRMGVFERLTSKRLPIEEKMGLSAAQMVQNEVIMGELEEEAQEKVNERAMHEIDRILNGWGCAK